MSDLINPGSILIVFVWGLFLVLFLRALSHKRVASRQARLIWMIYFLSCVAISFWGEDNETALNTHTGLEHVAVFIKYLALISVSHLYYLVLSDVKPEHSLISMKPVIFLATVVGLICFVLANYHLALTAEQFRYLFIAARDIVVSLYMIMSFIPALLLMYRAESVKIMRFKFACMLMLCLCFQITSLGSLTAFIWSVSNWRDPSLPASFVQPFVVAGLLFFLLTMIPHRWFFKLTHFRQIYIYYRLRNLEKRIFRKIGKNTRVSHNQIMKNHSVLELQIYRTTISILDHYPLLPKYKTTASLHDELDDCKQNTPDYDRLIRKLSRI